MPPFPEWQTTRNPNAKLFTGDVAAAPWDDDQQPNRRRVDEDSSWQSHLSHPTRSVRLVSCVPITPKMSYLLEACRTWPLPAEVLEQLRAMPEWEEARTWGGSCRPDG